jgi:hypothetical protein
MNQIVAEEAYSKNESTSVDTDLVNLKTPGKNAIKLSFIKIDKVT